MTQMIMTEEEVYLALVGIFAYIFLSILSLKAYKRDKGKILLFYSITWICNTAYLALEMLGSLLLSPLIWKTSYIVLSMSFVFWMLFIDHAFTDGISWKRFSIGAVYCAVFVFWVFMPSNAVSITLSNDGFQYIYTYTIPNEMLYIILFDSYTILFAITLVYWNVNTLKAIPKERKKEASIMLVAGLATLVSTVLFFLTDINVFPDIDGLFSTLSYLALIVGSFISTIIIYKFSNITHLLPYRVYRLLVMSKGGTPYFEYRWTDDYINTVLLSGLFSAISMMSKNITDEIQAGHIKAVNLEHLVFLMEPQYSPVTIGLVTSKISIDLKKSLQNFSSEFISKYSKDLYTDDGIAIEINSNPNETFLPDDMVEMVHRHFPSVPRYVDEGNATSELLGSIK